MSRTIRKWPTENVDVWAVIRWLQEYTPAKIVSINEDIPLQEYGAITPGKIGVKFSLPFEEANDVFQYLLQHNILKIIGSGVYLDTNALDELISQLTGDPLPPDEEPPMKYYNLYRGKPIINMSRTELMDAVVDLGDQLKLTKEEHFRLLDNMK